MVISHLQINYGFSCGTIYLGLAVCGFGLDLMFFCFQLFRYCLDMSIQYFEQFLKNKEYLNKSLVEIVLMILIAVGILIYQYHNLAETNLSKYWEWIDGGNPYIFLSLSITSCLLFFGLIFSLIRTPSVMLSPVPLYLFLILFTIFDARGGRISNWI